MNSKARQSDGGVGRGHAFIETGTCHFQQLTDYLPRYFILSLTVVYFQAVLSLPDNNPKGISALFIANSQTS